MEFHSQYPEKVRFLTGVNKIGIGIEMIEPDISSFNGCRCRVFKLLPPEFPSMVFFRLIVVPAKVCSRETRHSSSHGQVFCQKE